MGCYRVELFESAVSCFSCSKIEKACGHKVPQDLKFIQAEAPIKLKWEAAWH